MESFDMFLNGNFVALPAFQKRHSALLSDGSYAIPTKWQSSLFQAGQCGTFVGVFAAGPVTNILGYRWTTILALILMNVTIFVSFFVSSKTSHLLNQLPDCVPVSAFIGRPGCRTST